MDGRFSRIIRIFGDEGLQKLNDSHVAVFGIGGVGSVIAEALARSGIGHIDLIDNDKVEPSNINRQLEADSSSLGMMKTQAMKRHILLINPLCEVTEHNMFFLPDKEFDISGYDYIADAVDTISAKIELAVRADREKIPIISAMGTGNKLRPELLEIADIYETSVCPLARVMRHELKKRGVSKLKTVYSKEPPISPISFEETEKRTPASAMFVPAAAGLIMASEIVRYLTGSV